MDGIETSALTADQKAAVRNDLGVPSVSDLMNYEPKVTRQENPTDKDFNNYKATGRYSIGSPSDFINIPSTSSGTLIVEYAAYYVTQIYITATNTYSRRYSGSLWSDWQKLATENDIISNLSSTTYTKEQINSILSTQFNTRKTLKYIATGNYTTSWCKLFSFCIGKQYDAANLEFSIIANSLDRGAIIKGYIGGYCKQASTPSIWNKCDQLGSKDFFYSKEVLSDGKIEISIYAPTFTDNYMFYTISTSSNKDVTFVNLISAITDTSNLIAFNH